MRRAPDGSATRTRLTAKTRDPWRQPGEEMIEINQEDVQHRFGELVHQGTSISLPLSFYDGDMLSITALDCC